MDLAEYLKINGIMGTVFCKKINMKYDTFRRILEGKRMPKLDEAIAIEEATRKEVSCKDLLKYANKKAKHSKNPQNTN